jgi:hypothetical protein
MHIGNSGDLLLQKTTHRRKVLLGGIFAVCLLSAFFIIVWLVNRTPEAHEAPEAEMVLGAQIEMPFQVLIPAFLPRSFMREELQINTENVGPQGQPMIELVYPTRRGETLTFYEWLPTDQEIQQSATAGRCSCGSQAAVPSTDTSAQDDPLRVVGKVSSPDLITSEEARFVLDTLGPATNQQIFTSVKEVPLAYSLPPPVEVPINEAGIQEVTLVVTPSGYSPEHFAVKVDVPVVLTFRQLGQVGCGNELIFQWEKNETASLYLAFPTETQTLEFTPGETGEFPFNCPHYIYRGVMTVQD